MRDDRQAALLMKKLFAASALLAALCALSVPASAQWPDYPTANVPRKANGEPDLEGPVPRMADGKPDLSGVWQLKRTGRPRGPNEKPPPPPPGTPPLATFFNIGAGFPDGLPFQPWARKLREDRMAENNKDNPDAHCLPIGLTQFHMHPQPRKIIQTPNLIVILYESNYGVRQIFLDGRPSPPPDEVEPWWYGYSVGHWEGDTLVVQTTGLRDGGWLDVTGSPLTDQGKITERFRRVNYGNMQIDVTIDDPKAYTKPFTVRVNHQIMLNTDLIEFICLENEQSSRLYDQDEPAPADSAPETEASDGATTKSN
jgi:hypothetical protein